MNTEAIALLRAVQPHIDAGQQAGVVARSISLFLHQHDNNPERNHTMLETKIDELIKALNANTAALTGVKATDKPAKAVKTEDTAPDAPKALTYDDVKTPFLAFVKDKGREAGVALLAKFGAAKLPDVKPEQFADALAAINEAAKATESALA